MNRLIYYTLIAFLAMSIVHAGNFQEGQVILDDEVESFLVDLLAPIFNNASRNKASIPMSPKVLLIVGEVNASASFKGLIAVNTGLIIACKNVYQLLGVLAHEVGHVEAGHVPKMDLLITGAMVPGLMAILAGGAAALAAKDASPLIAGLYAGSHVAERSFLKDLRAFEEMADALAIKYLKNLNWPLEGLLQILEFLGKRDRSVGKVDAYTRSHPITEDRISRVRDAVRQSHAKISDSGLFLKKMEDRFQFVRAKVLGFTGEIHKLRATYPTIVGPYAKYAYVMWYLRERSFDKAAALLSELSKDHPHNLYFCELKGQIDFERGRMKEAVISYRQALKLRPRDHVLNLMFAHALLELNYKASPNEKNKNLDEAIKALTLSLEKEPDNVFSWRLLGRAYGEKGNTSCAKAAMAEEQSRLERTEEALSLAKKGVACSHRPLSERSKQLVSLLEGEQKIS